MPLKPILRHDARTNQDLQLATARDFIGVESAEEAAEGIRRGINRQTLWTRDVAAWNDVEHDRYGVHDTPRIPRAVIRLDYMYGGSSGLPPVDKYVIRPESYVMGRRATDPGTFAIAVVGDGVLDITFGVPMPSADYGVIDLCEAELIGQAAASRMTWQHVWVTGTPLSSTVLRVRRRADLPTVSDQHHGQMAFALVG